MSETLDPDTFDLGAWLSDAHLPEASADVYKRGDLAGEAAAIQRLLEIARENTTETERTSGTPSGVRKLERRYTDLVHQFKESRLTVYVRALTGDQLRDISDRNPRADGTSTEEHLRELGYEFLAAAIVGVATPRAERRDVTFTVTQVKALEKSIGQAQLMTIMEARKQAQFSTPVVDADFLRSASGDSDGSPE